MKQWVVHKFGGTSVGNADSMRKCVAIVAPLTKQQRVAVVVSAMGGKPKVTDLLLDLVHAAASNRQEEIEEKINLIRHKHQLCIEDILADAPEIGERILSQIDADLHDIRDLLRAVQLMKTAHEQILELVSGYGELWSASLMTEVMKRQGLPFIFLNARDVLLVSEHDTIGTKVHWEESEEKLNRFIEVAEKEFMATEANQKLFTGQSFPSGIPHLLITGYIATSINGIATTLKRDGSDFSASIFGKLLKASAITIWTDVSGVYSADPRRVPEAQILSQISYTEAVELAYFGAKVIHPKTMAPAIMDKIPIYIRNTFEPEHEGTRIFLSNQEEKTQTFFSRERAVCGFTTVDNIALLNVEGNGMIGVPGIAHRLFGALKAANVSVMFIAQASSEHSICFATHQSSADHAKQAIEQDFFYELRQKLICDVRVIRDCSIIAAVGESMRFMPGVSGLFFGSLGDASINVLSISQGCDERNISAVVYTKDSTRALRAVHSAFWLSSLDVSIGIVGTGRVGSAVLQTLIEQYQIMQERFGINIRLKGILNSRNMILGENLCESLKNKMSSLTEKSLGKKKNHSNVSLSDLEATMTDEQFEGKQITDMEKFLNYVKAEAMNPHAIIVDASTSDAMAALHPLWLRYGAHVVTANKRAMSSSLDLYNAVFKEVRMNNRMYMSEVTIGASLPVHTTLQDILSSGDAVHSIVGIMSVSAGVILTDICDEDMSFTQAVVKTFKQGLFEDDVFTDLEGSEAASKLLILGRQLGYPMTIDDIMVEPLASRRPVVSWTNPGEVFANEDKAMAERARVAKSHKCTLRYVQRITCSPPAELGTQKMMSVKATVALEEVPLDSIQALVKGAVYHFSFHTERYQQNPLIIQGPLSDSQNTASGIVGDILRIARSIGAKDKGPEALHKLG